MMEPLSIFEKMKLQALLTRQSSVQTRILKLKKLRNRITTRSDEIKAALHKDFRKPPEEVDLLEIFTALAEIDFAVRHLKNWMNPKAAKTPLSYLGTRS